jgi:RNA polymerase sigma-70 factor (ECF subfamily)
MLGNDIDAEDVTQDVFVQVMRRLDTFRGESQLTTWLHRVTVNAVLLHRRKAARRRERQPGAPFDRLLEEGAKGLPARPRPAPPDRQLLVQEAQELIERAIAGLPPVYRDVYVLADVEGLPNAEVAALLGLRLPATKSRLHRARLLMRAALAPHFQEMDAP